jgi:hypothetical protein
VLLLDDGEDVLEQSNLDEILRGRSSIDRPTFVPPAALVPCVHGMVVANFPARPTSAQYAARLARVCQDREQSAPFITPEYDADVQIACIDQDNSTGEAERWVYGEA